MNMVGIILGIIVFNQQARPVQPVIMRPARLQAAGPGKMNSLAARLANLVPLGAGKVIP